MNFTRKFARALENLITNTHKLVKIAHEKQNYLPGICGYCRLTQLPTLPISHARLGTQNPTPIIYVRSADILQG